MTRSHRNPDTGASRIGWLLDWASRVYWRKLTLGLLFRAALLAAVVVILVPTLLFGTILDTDPSDRTLSIVMAVIGVPFWVAIVLVELGIDPASQKCSECGTRFKQGHSTCRKCGNSYVTV